MLENVSPKDEVSQRELFGPVTCLYRVHNFDDALQLANGTQYVAMPAGIGGGSWSTLIAPELAPEIRRPNSGNALLVFALPAGAR